MIEDYEKDSHELFFTLYGDQVVTIANEYGNWTEVSLEDLYSVFEARLLARLEDTYKLSKLP